MPTPLGNTLMKLHSLTTLALILTPALVEAANVQCMIGSTRCIKSQGTEIPSKQVIEILERCGDFVTNDIGRIALKLSAKEVLDRTGGRLTPLSLAWHTFPDLQDSPLKFERKKKVEETSYAEVKRACLTLQNDFNNDAKWTK
jgi:hypothetical protein